jgi:hypothetical protein
MRKTLIAVLAFMPMFFNSLPSLAGVISANNGEGSHGGRITIRGAYLNSTINLNANGGVGRNGGNLSFRDKDEEFQHIQGTWSFRALDDCCLQYPEYVTSLNSNKTRLLVSKVEDGVSEPSNQSNVTDWYSEFREALINNFHPVTRGAVGAKIKVHKGAVESIEFFGYNSAPPFSKDEAAPNSVPPLTPQPNVKEVADNESAFKANVSDTLAKTANALSARFPAEAQDIDLKVIFAGDPQGKGYWWTSWFLIDKANYPRAISSKE